MSIQIGAIAELLLPLLFMFYLFQLVGVWYLLFDNRIKLKGRLFLLYHIPVVPLIVLVVYRTRKNGW